MSGQTFQMVSCGSLLTRIRVSFVATDQWASTGLSRHNSSLTGLKNPAKFENDCISRNGHGIKTNQPNFMILVSFSSAEDALSNAVNNYNTFSSQGTENPTFRFLGHPVYDGIHDINVKLLKNKCFGAKRTHFHFRLTLLIKTSKIYFSLYCGMDYHSKNIILFYTLVSSFCCVSHA